MNSQILVLGFFIMFKRIKINLLKGKKSGII